MIVIASSLNPLLAVIEKFPVVAKEPAVKGGDMGSGREPASPVTA
jgi:hypothetical protein